MSEKILVIDSSPLLRDFIKEQLEDYGFEIILAKNGLDGLIKMRNQLPDLVIMDYFLPKLDGGEFLKEKNELKGTTDIPVIMLTNKQMDRKTILNLGKHKIFKIIPKPIEIDTLYQTLSTLFKRQFILDTNPCIIDIHLNDDILFIEIAKGLNKHKVSLIRYKIIEIMKLYNMEIKKILIIFTDIKQQDNLIEMLNKLMDNILGPANATPGNICILTSISHIKNYFAKRPKFQFTHITNDFVKAIESLGKIDYVTFEAEKIESVKTDLVSSSLHDEGSNPSVKLKFSDEKLDDETLENGKNNKKRKMIIAVVDDDLPILEFMETVLSQSNWKICVYENGKMFIDDLKENKPDLLFLDLFMPVMSGFEVLDFLSNSTYHFPVIILTAYPDKNSILKARHFGVKSYLTKPVKADFIVHKAEEILNSDF